MEDDIDIFKWILVIIVCVGLVVGGAFWLESGTCIQKWSGSGMAAQWGLMSGCRIEVKPGQWIPEERYREFAK